MKAPRKVSAVKVSPALQAELRLKDKLEKAKKLVKDDTVWKHDSGTEYTVILVVNENATKSGYPVWVNYYGPDGKYWGQTLDRFVEDKTFVCKKDLRLSPGEEALGPWMSGGLEDPDSCAEFKAAAELWLNELPFPTVTEKP